MDFLFLFLFSLLEKFLFLFALLSYFFKLVHLFSYKFLILLTEGFLLLLKSVKSLGQFVLCVLEVVKLSFLGLYFLLSLLNFLLLLPQIVNLAFHS